MLYSLRRFSENEIAPQRMKIIKFYNQYGERAVKEAFGADRKLISRWKQRLVKSKGRLSSLIPLSTRPHQLRISQVDRRITTFIKGLREDHPRIGKDKIKPDLDIYCRQLGITTVSVSTIGNIIKRNHFFFQTQGRIYHDPASKWAVGRKYQKRLRIRHSPKPTDYGHIVSDTVEKITDGVKDYFMSAIDARMKFALTLNYKHITSANMRDFYFRFRKVYPAKIRVWQSDNGRENLGLFDRQLETDGVASYDDLGKGGPRLTIRKEAFRIQFQQYNQHNQPSLTEIFAHEFIHLWQDANFPNLMVGWRHIGAFSIAGTGLVGTKVGKEVSKLPPLKTEIEYLFKENQLSAAALQTIIYGMPTIAGAIMGMRNYYNYSPLEKHAQQEAPRIAQLWEEQFPGRPLLTLDPV